MKKEIALLLSLFITFSMTACGAEKSSEAVTASTTTQAEILTTTTATELENTTTEPSNAVSTTLKNESVTTTKKSTSTTSTKRLSSTKKTTTTHTTTTTQKPASTAQSITTTKKSTSTTSTKRLSSAKKTTTTHTTTTTQKPTTTTQTTNQNTLKNITATHIGKKLKIGDTLTNSDFEVIGYYSDGSEEPITDFSIDVKTPKKIGNNDIVLSYKNKVFCITLYVYEANAANANSGGEFGYNINDNGELTITSYVGAKTDVVVPTWIDDMPVTGIDHLSEKITSVVLPNSITYINRHAFSGYQNLVSVTLGPNITYMGDNIFYQCTNLKNVTIKEGAKLIGDSMFSACTALEKIVLPNTIEKIEGDAFAFCENFKEITIPPSVKEISDWGIFSGSYKLEKVYVKQNSYAQRWCLNNDYGEKVVYY